MSTPRKRDQKGQGTVSTSMELTDRPNLALVRDRGQRQRLEGGGVENLRCEFQLSVCDFLFFFHYWHVRRVEEARKKKKKKKNTLLGHQSPASCTNSGVRHMSDTNTSPKLACLCNLGHNILVAFLFI